MSSPFFVGKPMEQSSPNSIWVPVNQPVFSRWIFLDFAISLCLTIACSISKRTREKMLFSKICRSKTTRPSNFWHVAKLSAYSSLIARRFERCCARWHQIPLRISPLLSRSIVQDRWVLMPITITRIERISGRKSNLSIRNFQSRSARSCKIRMD